MPPARPSVPRHASSLSAVLADEDAARRMLVLRELQATLAEAGVHSALARTRRLALRWNSPGPCRPSGPTDPELHVLTATGTVIATTDGVSYRVRGGAQDPASDPAGAAALIAGQPLPTLRR